MAEKPQAKMAGGKRRSSTSTMGVTAEDVFGCDGRALDLLAASDRKTWQRLVPHLDPAKPCPAELLRALLAIDTLEGWRGRIFKAFSGLNPDDGMGADYNFVH